MVTGAEGAGMVGSQKVGAVGEGLLEQGDSLVEPAGGLVGAGEVVTRVEGVGMVGSQNVGVVSESLLEQGDSLTDPAGGLVGAGEIVA